MSSDVECGSADALSRLHLLLGAVAATPSDADVVELGLSQAIAVTGAGSAVLGTLRDPATLDLAMASGGGGSISRCGALRVGSRYPLTDAIARQRSVWLSSAAEIAAAYPTAGGLWGRAFAAVPIMVRGLPIGAIGVIHDDGNHVFTDAERLCLRAIADICAVVMAHRQAIGIVRPMPPLGHRYAAHDAGR
ncbi:GAF domain-containing protein [Actinoplanes sp. NPDC051346]|uniref:GAF domain-containing protein n=1 Tax=Actinoplanes sp. NPDC051346 TaxID=3155048 RepID=UPI0034371124